MVELINPVPLEDLIKEFIFKEFSEIVKNVDREQITVSTAVNALNSEKYANPEYVVLFADIQILTNTIRVTSDGKTTPTATVGKAWYPDEVYRVWGRFNLGSLRFVRESANATLIIDYWGKEIKDEQK